MHKISVYRINVQTEYKCKMLQNKDFKAIFNIAISSQDSLGKNEKWEKKPACTYWSFMCCNIPWQNGPNQLLKHPLVQCPELGSQPVLFKQFVLLQVYLHSKPKYPGSQSTKKKINNNNKKTLNITMWINIF